MIQFSNKSKGGYVRVIETFMYVPTNPKSYASSVLLNKYYWDQDPDNPKIQRMEMIGFSRKFLTKVKKKYGDIHCVYCGKPHLIIELEGMIVSNGSKATIDHLIATSKGGEFKDPKNIVPSCGKCNSKKGDKSPDEFPVKFPYNNKEKRITL